MRIVVIELVFIDFLVLLEKCVEFCVFGRFGKGDEGVVMSFVVCLIFFNIYD